MSIFATATPLNHCRVYVLFDTCATNLRLSGMMGDIVFGITPEPDVLRRLESELPDVQRTLNWMHLASRYSVCVRLSNPPAGLFRIGESMVVAIRGE